MRQIFVPLAALSTVVTTGQVAAAQEVYREEIAGTVVSLEMIHVPAGRVRLATAGTEKELAVGPFWMSKIEIPWDVYDVWAFGLDRGGQTGAAENVDATSRPSAPYVLPGEGFGHHGRPALGMSYHAAEQFALWFSQKTGKNYRLPTEAEWEYACRANQAEPEDLKEYAWYWENSEDKTQPGATRKPNAFGLADMLGNVGEWVAAEGGHVLKGGAFLDDAEDVHCGARQAQTPAWNATDPQLPKSKWWLSDAPFVGLRLVRDP